MIIFLLILTIIFIVGISIGDKMYNDAILITCGIGVFVFGSITMFLIITAIWYQFDCYGINDKIKMYQEENEVIEQQIDILVKQYMNYESDTLKEFSGKSSIALVTMYPELKSDTLVQNQINTYTANNNKIKELKEIKIKRGLIKWLWYFGK